MNHFPFQLVLADWESFVVPAIAVILWLVGAIASAVKGVTKAAEEKSDPEAQQQRDELAQKRRRQLEEMVREKQERPAPAKPAPKPTGLADALRQMIEQAKRTMEEQARPKPQTPTAAPPRPAKGKKRKPAKPQPAQPVRMSPLAGEPGHETEDVHRHVTNTPDVVLSRANPRFDGAKLSARDLRKGFVMKEILDTPVSLRS